MSVVPLATLAAPQRLAQEVKKSRFVAHAWPVAAPADALARLEEVRDATASHHCWAYRLGQQYRFSDDGEPGGTAGKPILQAIDGQGCDRVMVVVARWFGGIKLGAGGLVRAYGGCAAECLRQAQKLPLVEKRALRLWLPFAALPVLQARLGDFDAERQGEDFDAEGVTLALALPPHHIPALTRLAGDLSRGRARVEREG